MRNGIIAGFAAAALYSHTVPVYALEVSRSRDMPAPPAAVWAIMGSFCSIALWHPQVEKCISYDNEEDNAPKVGDPVRGLVVSGGLGTLLEAETSRDESRMTYSYTFIHGPLPVSAYTATITVRPNGSGSTVTWTATFDAAGMSEAEAKADIEGVYDQGLSGIARETAK